MRYSPRARWGFPHIMRLIYLLEKYPYIPLPGLPRVDLPMYKVAFFGSDLFSLASFRSLLNLKHAHPHLIDDISLVTRKLKASGRGMKNIVVPPIAEHAQNNNIAWLQVDSAQDFEQLDREKYNLAVAVSYGNLIPASFLQSLRFGGLNVHPSLLPRYRGASPLQYAIMNRDAFTGVSVQTLHPTKFDHGEVLWRSQPYSLEHKRVTLPELSHDLSLLGAQGLCEVIENHLAPVEGPTYDVKSSKAPVTNPKMCKIDFAASAAQNDAKGRALLKLFFEQKVEQKQLKRGKKPKGLPQLRVNLADFEPVDHLLDSQSSTEETPEVGAVCEGVSAAGEPLLALKVSDGFIGVKTVTVQGFKAEPARSYFENKEKRKLCEVIV